jgi:hypothetical protein
VTFVRSARPIVPPQAALAGRNSYVIFESSELVEKLASLVTSLRFNIVRYYGVLAPAARWRPSVVPSNPAAGDIVSHPGCAAKKLDPCPEAKSSHKRRCHPRNYSMVVLRHQVLLRSIESFMKQYITDEFDSSNSNLS